MISSCHFFLMLPHPHSLFEAFPPRLSHFTTCFCLAHEEKGNHPHPRSIWRWMRSIFWGKFLREDSNVFWAWVGEQRMGHVLYSSRPSTGHLPPSPSHLSVNMKWMNGMTLSLAHLGLKVLVLIHVSLSLLTLESHTLHNRPKAHCTVWQTFWSVCNLVGPPLSTGLTLRGYPPTPSLCHLKS